VCNVSVARLTRFKQEHSIHKTAIQGERTGAVNATADTFHTEFHKFIQQKDLKLDQINNTNDNGLS
jgi:hypothetical protein